ncbi:MULTISPECIES: hypothetical protein [unclassified Proteiniphilum]|uniref:hypothetical protein n=1 Tax=unclassified Proteiniphilum TaxID=2622718 RepID=UPI0025DC6473|nr:MULTISPECIES: hypothetical protein [unclassified Proteiniphilum]MEA5126698.1 hypothetical protein [Proteiniphilum sp.]
MRRNGIRFYTDYLFSKDRRIYREISRRYHSHPWVIYRLMHGTSIRSEKELGIFRRLTEEYPGSQSGYGE